ncbi:MAG TPA: class I SAM-dependent methyltransferase [Actinomycetota bacterium]|nr:class I SAM-dependent methyltransferase [Actinomycetota bacterium]
MRGVNGKLDYIARNQASWTEWAPEYVEKGRSNWAGDVTWGIWSIPEEDLGILPDVRHLDVIELGCGTGYVSAWLARRGARPVGLDPTAAQLETAAGFQEEFGIRFPLVRAAAEASPFQDCSFDIVISEYGAAIWSDPYRWIPEAARLLRPGGELIFLANGALLMLCMPDDDGTTPASATMLRDYLGMHRLEWTDDDSVNFHLPHGEWISLLRANGFEVEELIEVQAPEGATTSYPFVTADWARRWPSEEVWKARKRITS